MAEQPPIFSHDVKIEQSAKGARVTVHTFASDPQVAIDQAVKLYQETKKALETAGELVAPIEAGRKGE